MKNSFSLKAGVLLTTAFGIVLVSGSIGGVPLPRMLFLRALRRAI